MNVKKTRRLDRRWTAAELRKLPPAERDAVMEAAAALAEEDYRNDPQLTAFEAFGKDDLYGESSQFRDEVKSGWSTSIRQLGRRSKRFDRR